MRNMGRLFQYNRFGATEQSTQDSKKDIQTHSCFKTKEPQQQFDANCPLTYAELYPDCACHSIEATATPRACTTSDEGVTTTTATTTMTSRSIDLALRKYQQWSSKFLATTTATTCSNTLPVPTTTNSTAAQQVATNTDYVTQLSTSSSQKSNSCSYSTNPSAATSGYYSRQTMIGGNVSPTEREERARGQFWGVGGDRELLVSASKRPKVYDCMKDFLRRKLFQQRHGQQEEQQQQQAQLEATLCKSDTEEDVTSDYDEVDMLDSSYNADEEDASDCSSQCTFPLESDIEDVEQTKQQSLPIEQQQQQRNNSRNSAPQKSISPQKSMLSLNCWQNFTHYTDSTTEPEDPEEEEAANETASERHAQIFDYQNVIDDSDAGISDCCQLISENASPTKQRKRPQKLKSCQKQKSKQQRTRYNRNSHGGEEEEELLASSWYQPRITTKAALEHLQHAAPGTFLLRRKSRTYELCLRAETKVKHFIVIALADNHYKLKGAKKEFTSLKALVTHHSVMAEQLPLTLTLPREYNNKRNFYAPNSGKCAKSLAFEVSARALRSLRYADDFDTYESLQILGLLRDWQYEANEI